jgi:hypothetical protein
MSWEGKMKNKPPYELYLYGKLVMELTEKFDLIGQDILQLMSDYNEKHHPAEMQLSIMDLINDDLELLKQIDLEDELGDLYE